MRVRHSAVIAEELSHHSAVIAEDSQFVYFYSVGVKILRFAQDEKLGFVGIILCGRAGACSRR